MRGVEGFVAVWGLGVRGRDIGVSFEDEKEFVRKRSLERKWWI